MQLATIEAALARAADGNGAMVAIEGAAGMGKTSLLQAAERQAAAGMTVLAAPGEDLERGLPWGLARRLLGPALAGPDRKALADGAAPAAPLFDRSAPRRRRARSPADSAPASGSRNRLRGRRPGIRPRRR
jgi:hypothetical protein